MATAKILKSGNYRVRVYAYTDSSGKKIYESFTASTKAEAEMMASKFANKKLRNNNIGMTVEQAVNGYLTSKSGVLSPSTRRAYKNNIDNHYGPLLNRKIAKLSNEDMQLFITDLSVNKHLSKKTIENIYKQLTSSIKFYDKSIEFNVTLPEKSGQGRIRNAKAKNPPTDDEVSRLLLLASPWLKAVIALSAFGSLRRSEIAALKYGDIEGNTICIHAHMVQDENDKWIWEDRNKEEASFRYVTYPKEIIDMLYDLGDGQPDEFIIKYNPNTISKMFIKLKKRANVNIDIRLHDMRHYFASVGAKLGIPSLYLARMGGWDPDSPIMKKVYQGTFEEEEAQYRQEMSNQFYNFCKKAK